MGIEQASSAEQTQYLDKLLLQPNQNLFEQEPLATPLQQLAADLPASITARLNQPNKFLKSQYPSAGDTIDPLSFVRRFTGRLSSLLKGHPTLAEQESALSANPSIMVILPLWAPALMPHLLGSSPLKLLAN